MMKAILIGAMIAGTAFAAPASAQTSPNLSAAFQGCLARARGNTVQSNLCAQRESSAQDDRLNKAYQRVMRQLGNDPRAKAALRTEERRWIAERDYKCKVNGDTMDSGCVVFRTAARADALERRIRF